MKLTRQPKNPPPASLWEVGRGTPPAVLAHRRGRCAPFAEQPGPGAHGVTRPTRKSGMGLPGSTAAFTMVEIAISLAIIGFALVAIIGALPKGMNVQRENREQTIINQDAGYLIDAIRSGARGLDDLTNYVVAITNYWADYDVNTNLVDNGRSGYFFLGSTTAPPFPLTNGYRIVGLLGTPKCLPGPIPPFRSNHVVAYVRALSGLVTEKFPQDNLDVRQDAFSYRLISENVPLAVPPDYGTNSANSSDRQLTHNLRELRLSFSWPLLPGGKVGKGRQTFRTMVAGVLTNDPPGGVTWFFQPQTFVKAP